MAENDTEKTVVMLPTGKKSETYREEEPKKKKEGPKRITLILVIVGLLILGGIGRIVIKKFKKKPPLPKPGIVITLENYIPKGATGLLCINNLNGEITAIKKTNFYGEFLNFLKWYKTLNYQDVKKLSKKTAGKLTESNILSTYGKKSVVAFYTSKPDDTKIVLISHLGQTSDILDRFKKIVGENIHLGKYKDISIDIYDFNKFYTVINNDVLVVSNDIDLFKKSIDLIKGEKGGSVVDEPTFTNSLLCSSKDSFLYLYADIAQVENFLKTKFKAQGYGAGSEFLENFYVEAKIKDGFTVKSFGGFKKDIDKELKSIFASEPGKLESLRFVSKEPLIYASNNSFNSSVWWKNYREKISKTPGGNIINPLICQLGDKFEKNFISQIGNEVGYALMDFQMPISKIKFAAFLKVKNNKTIDKFLKEFFEGKKLKLTEKNYDGVIIKTISIPTPIQFIGNIELSYAFLNKFLILAISPDTISEFVDISKNKKPSFETSDLYKKLNIPEKVNSSGFVNTGALLKRGIIMYSDFSRKVRPTFVEPFDLTPLVKLSDVLLPFGGYSLYNEAGIMSDSCISLKDLKKEEWKGIFGKLSEQLQKREISVNESRTKENLTILNTAVNLYYIKNKKLPKSLDELVPNAIKEIPKEMITGSNNVVLRFTGKGGWCYDIKKKKVSPNLSGNDSKNVKYTNW